MATERFGLFPHTALKYQNLTISVNGPDGVALSFDDSDLLCEIPMNDLNAFSEFLKEVVRMTDYHQARGLQNQGIDAHQIIWIQNALKERTPKEILDGLRSQDQPVETWLEDYLLSLISE